MFIAVRIPSSAGLVFVPPLFFGVDIGFQSVYVDGFCYLSAHRILWVCSEYLDVYGFLNTFVLITHMPLDHAVARL